MIPIETLDQVVKECAALYADRIALQRYTPQQLLPCTYAQLVERFQTGAAQIQYWGVKEGDRVILLADNSPEWIVAYLAALAAKTTVVLLDPGLTPADLAALIERSDPRAILISQPQYHKLADWLDLGLPILNIDHAFAPLHDPQKSLKSPLLPTPDPDATLASMIFTSGTTGKPKGVLLGHSGLLHNARCGMESLGFQPNHPAHNILCVLPLHHIAALTCSLTALLMGATLTFVETLQKETLLDAMRATHTTILPAVPRLLELLYGEIQRRVAARGGVARGLFYGLGNLCNQIRTVTGLNLAPLVFRSVHQAFGGYLQLFLCGAAPLSPTVEQGLEQLGFTVLKGYGLTETGVVIFNTVHQDRLGHVGQPFSGIDVRVEKAIKDAAVTTDPALSSGEGEICLRGPTLMHGYFRDQAATDKVIRDGWFYTGDMGHFDANRNLFITGRLKELIITPAGKKAAPEAVEHYYQNLPGVKELAVFGMPVEHGYGEAIHAAVIPDCATVETHESHQSVQQMIERAIASRSSQVPSYLQIQQVHCVDALPKTTTLKVKRSQLQRDMTDKLNRSKTVQQNTTRVPHAIALEEVDETTQRVLAIVGELTREMGRTDPVTLDSTLQFDLGLDSLGLMELAAALEQALGVPFTMDVLPVLHTVGNLVKAVQDARANPMAFTNHASRTNLLDGDPAESVPPPRTGLECFCLTLFRFLSPLLWKIEVTGIEHLPKTGPFILCPNQESDLDTLWVSSCLPIALQYQLCCAAKREMFDQPKGRFMASLVGGIPINREGNSLPALRACAKVLRSGRPLLIYPEGTRTRSGELLPFYRGPAKLALYTGVPIIPVRLNGSFRIFPYYRSLPRVFDWQTLQRLSLQIRFGTPINPPETAQGTSTEVLLTQTLRETIEALSSRPPS